MQTRIVTAVLVVALALGIGWYVKAQNAVLDLNFSPGDVLRAADLNAIVTQVNANTLEVEANNAALTNPGLRFVATMSGAQEVTTTPLQPGGLTDGTISLQFDAGLTQAVATITLAGNAANANRAHLHCNFAGLNGGIPFGFVAPGPCDVADLADGSLTCTITNADFTGTDCVPSIGVPVNNIAALYFAAKNGGIYANVHTVENPGGEIRGQLLGPLP